MVCFLGRRRKGKRAKTCFCGQLSRRLDGRRLDSLDPETRKLGKREKKEAKDTRARGIRPSNTTRDSAPEQGDPVGGQEEMEGGCQEAGLLLVGPKRQPPRANLALRTIAAAIPSATFPLNGAPSALAPRRIPPPEVPPGCLSCMGDGGEVAPRQAQPRGTRLAGLTSRPASSVSRDPFLFGAFPLVRRVPLSASLVVPSGLGRRP